MTAAPAAADTIRQNLEDFGRKSEDYDKIITGDLGMVGQKLLFDLLEEQRFERVFALFQGLLHDHSDCSDVAIDFTFGLWYTIL